MKIGSNRLVHLLRFSGGYYTFALNIWDTSGVKSMQVIRISGVVPLTYIDYLER